MITLDGKDNHGKPRQEFADRIGAETDDKFIKTCENYIWLSAYAANNPRSDYHWQADACYDEAKARGNTDLYQQGWRRAAGKA